jgi:hypothetical protein
MIGTIWWIDIGFAVATALVALVAVASYLPVVRSTDSTFARRLLIAALLLLGAAVVTTGAFVDLGSTYGSDVAFPLLGVAVLQLASTGVLAHLIRT